jgi:murein DD-endopeptidase MepM/ murein hydrolase activator NlpD
MNIILVTSRLPAAKAISIGRGHIVGGCLLLAVTVLAFAGILNYAVLRYAAETRNPIVFSLFSEVLQEDAAKTQAYLRDNLDTMATRLGAMQAQILRLNNLGERVARLAGFKPQEFVLDQAPGRGGALSQIPSKPLSFTELALRLDFLARQVDDRSDIFGLLDSVLTQDSARKQLLPSVLPIQGGAYNSNFGWRLDPFSGRQSFHDGIDFDAARGTAVRAAAAGVVVASAFHAQYGNMIEIDHGNGLVTLYAHCSKRLARLGDVVMKGAKIGEVGGTGRATGPHLHFEVRHHGVPQHPARFLRLSG